jgi:RTX calcium-binding nonapeptide repeat (4 copies)
MRMRRATLLFTAVVVVILLAGGVALAKNISCARQDTRVCKGTNNPDVITGTNRGETIKARGSGDGVDQIMARGGKDKVFGEDGADFIFGGAGNDTLDAGPNLTTRTDSDFIAGEAGNDTLVESPSVDRYGFGPDWGQDTITGDGDQPGSQPDSDGLCFACSGVVTTDVTINLTAGTATSGTNSVTWDTTNGPFIEDATGGSGNDNITGSTRFNIVNGYLGADTINVKDGNGGDIVNCGNDTVTDTVTKDDGDTLQGDSCNGDTIISTP